MSRLYHSNFTLRTLLSGLFVALFVIVTNSVTWADEPVSEAKKFFDAMSPEQFSDPVALDDFIRRFPESDEARIAFAFRYSLLEKLPTIEGYNEFIKKYPDKLQAQLAIQEVFKLYRYQNRVSGYYDFVKRYPNTQQALVAMLRIQELMFEYVCKLDKEEEYDAFISAFPDAPQVTLALEKAKQKALDKEQADFNQYVKEHSTREDKLDQASEKITGWEQIVKKFYRNYPSIDSSVQIEVRLQLYKIERQADVLQEVYGRYDQSGRVQRSLDSLEIMKRLDKIQATLQANHAELLAKLEAESDKICKGLEQLHADNQQLIQDVRTGFTALHQDLVDIKAQLTNIDENLKKMDRHLEEINRSIVEGFKQTNETLNRNFERLNKTVQTGFEIQATLQRQTLAELRTQTQQLSNLTQIAQSGFESVGSLWESQTASYQSSQMNDRFTSVGSGSSMVAKLVGGIAGAAATFIPTVGPYVAPAIAKLTTSAVDNFVIPCTQEIYAHVTDPNNRGTMSENVISSAKITGTKAKEQIAEALPQIWAEEKGNILHAAQILADKNEIPEELSRPVLAAVSSGNLQEAIIPLAEQCNVSPEALMFAADYIY